jgi:hypothetical protein
MLSVSVAGDNAFNRDTSHALSMTSVEKYITKAATWVIGKKAQRLKRKPSLRW